MLNYVHMKITYILRKNEMSVDDEYVGGETDFRYANKINQTAVKQIKMGLMSM